MADLQKQENSSRFTNVSVIAPESQGQHEQQKQQEQLEQQKQPTGLLKGLNGFPSAPQPLFMEDPPSTVSGELNDNPAWFNNPRKRAIPNSIIKRSNGQSLSPVRSDSADVPAFSNSNGFNNVTFGSKKDPRILKNVSPNDNNSANNNAHSSDLGTVVFDSNEAPPKTSLADWQKEDGIFSSKTDNIEDPNLSSNITFDGKPTATPSPFRPLEKISRILNFFDKNTKTTPNTASSEASAGSKEGASTNWDDHAIIIFGYPETIANSIIFHFANFGEILEDFRVIKDFKKLNSKNMSKSPSLTAQKYPIYTGDGWVKLTYKSELSKSRALQENGIIMNGTLIGCVSYSPAALKQLASLKKSEEIINNKTSSQTSLSSKDLSNYRKTEGIFEKAKAKAVTSKVRNAEFKVSKNSTSFKNPRRLEIKDGRSLFLRNRGKIHSGVLSSIESDLKKREQASKSKKSWLNRLNNWLFGWNDL